MSGGRASGFPVRSHLHCARGWISDTIWVAHRDLALFGKLHDWINPVLPGVYDLGSTGKPTWMCATELVVTLDQLRECPLRPCTFVQKDDPIYRDSIDALTPDDVMTGAAWVAFDCEQPSGISIFNGNIAEASTLPPKADVRVDTWHLGTGALGRTVLVGSQGERVLFALAAVRQQQQIEAPV